MAVPAPASIRQASREDEEEGGGSSSSPAASSPGVHTLGLGALDRTIAWLVTCLSVADVYIHPVELAFLDGISPPPPAAPPKIAKSENTAIFGAAAFQSAFRVSCVVGLPYL
jgi:hypothetical protein